MPDRHSFYLDNPELTDAAFDWPISYDEPLEAILEDYFADYIEDPTPEDIAQAIFDLGIESISEDEDDLPEPAQPRSCIFGNAQPI